LGLRGGLGRTALESISCGKGLGRLDLGMVKSPRLLGDEKNGQLVPVGVLKKREKKPVGVCPGVRFCQGARGVATGPRWCVAGGHLKWVSGRGDRRCVGFKVRRKNGRTRKGRAEAANKKKSERPEITNPHREGIGEKKMIVQQQPVETEDSHRGQKKNASLREYNGVSGWRHLARKLFNRRHGKKWVDRWKLEKTGCRQKKPKKKGSTGCRCGQQNRRRVRRIGRERGPKSGTRPQHNKGLNRGGTPKKKTNATMGRKDGRGVPRVVRAAKNSKGGTKGEGEIEDIKTMRGARASRDSLPGGRARTEILIT